LEGFGGNVYIQFTQTEYLRVSDLSPIRSDLDLYIRFVPSGISFLEQILGDITITTTYSPVNENYDFPIRIDERWTTTTTFFLSMVRSKRLHHAVPPPETDTNTTTWVVTDTGKPRNMVGQSIDYGGCNESYEMTSINSDGIPKATAGIALKYGIMLGFTPLMTLASRLISSSSATTQWGPPAWNPTPIQEPDRSA